jgi:hypothetical protein
MNKYNQLIHKGDIYENLDVLPLEIENNNICPLVKERVLSLVEEESPVIIEVGSWKGSSAIEMAKYFKKNGQNPTIFCVDTWNGSGFHRRDDFWLNQLKCKNGYPQLYYQFLSNVVHNDCQENIVPIPLNSLDAARFLRGEYLKELNIQADLIYIDASHEYADVINDLEAYSSLLKKSSVFFGDDYDSGWPGVVAAVDGFAHINGLKDRFSIIRSQWVLNLKD